MTDLPKELTQLLIRYGEGRRDALDALLPAVYQELRRLAGGYMRRENKAHTLQPTALVHEAFFRLIDQNEIQWKNRAQFFGVAASLMRRILIDHARARLADKRGGGQIRVEFDEAIHPVSTTAADAEAELVALDTALKRLAAIDERQARVVELRYFGGLSIEETAEALEASPATVKRDWVLARNWLQRELSDASPAE